MSDLTELNDKVNTEIEKLKSESIEDADYIFDNPELSQMNISLKMMARL